MDAAIERIAEATDGWVGADLAATCDQARLLALRAAGYARHVVVGPDTLEAAYSEATEWVGRRPADRWKSP
jgi:ATP-dependent 26S proteasome regulatory subunit